MPLPLRFKWLPIASVPAVVCVATVIVDPLSDRLRESWPIRLASAAAVRFKPAVAETSRVVPADMVMFGEASSGVPAARTSEPPLMSVSPSIEIVALLNVQCRRLPCGSSGAWLSRRVPRLPVSSARPAPENRSVRNGAVAGVVVDVAADGQLVGGRFNAVLAAAGCQVDRSGQVLLPLKLLRWTGASTRSGGRQSRGAQRRRSRLPVQLEAATASRGHQRAAGDVAKGIRRRGAIYQRPRRSDLPKAGCCRRHQDSSRLVFLVMFPPAA